MEMLILIAQKKGRDALNATQKTSVLCKVPFLKNSRKTAKNGHFRKNGYFWHFFYLFLETVLFRELRFFCVAFSAPGPFFWAIKINILTTFQIIHHKGGPL